MTRLRTKAAGTGVAMLLGMGGVVAIASTSGAQDSPPADDPAIEVPDVEDHEADAGCEWFEENLTDEDVAELQAEIDAMVEALDAAGVEYQLVPDELGLSFPEPIGDDEASWEAFEGVLAELWAEEFAALSAEEQAEIVAHEAEFAAELRSALDEAGIAYELETDPVTGVELPLFDEEDESVWEALDELDLDEDLFEEDDEQAEDEEAGEAA